MIQIKTQKLKSKIFRSYGLEEYLTLGRIRKLVKWVVICWTVLSTQSIVLGIRISQCCFN